MSEIKNPKPRPPIRWGHVETEPTPISPAAIVPLSEAARNHLTIAQNDRHNDPIIIARAVKELERFRGDPAVDFWFKRQDDAKKLAALKVRIVAFKERKI